MKKSIKLLMTFIITISLYFNNITVFSYEINDPSHLNNVLKLRQEIHNNTDYYYTYFDKFSNSNMTSMYFGVCSTVQVDGKTYPLEEYVAGVVNAEVGSESNAPEALKAHAIAARSYLLKTSDCSKPITNGQSYQAFKETTTDSVYYKAAMDTAGIILTINGDPILTEYTSYPNAIFQTETSNSWKISFQRIRGRSDTAWTWEGPSKEEVLSYNNYKPKKGAPSLDHHYGMSSVVAVYLEHAKSYSYEQILKLFYGDDIVLTKIADGSYIGDLSFVSGNFGQIYYFNQTDYKDYYYGSNSRVAEYIGSDGSYATISSHGCGPTSLSMVISSFKGEAHGPIEITEKVCQAGGCTSGGSFQWGLKNVAEQYGLKAYYVPLSSSQVALDELSSGDALIIALMGPGTFTTGGHFIVLTGVNSDGTVSVADPASRARTEKKWFSFNLILEQAKADFLVIKK